MTVDSILAEFVRYKTLAERAIDQLPTDSLHSTLGDDINSTATLIWHLSQNLKSRYTDFLVDGIDGEKPWRDHPGEFMPKDRKLNDLLNAWNEGFGCMEAAVTKLNDSDLERKVVIRGVSLKVHAALHRSLAHFTYHVGQIVILARYFAKDEWQGLTVLSGGKGSDSESNASVKW